MQSHVTTDTGPCTARIVLTGDHPIMRAAVRRLVESEEGMVVVRECANTPESLKAALGADPDLIVLDLDLTARCNGVLERVGALLHAAQGTPVLILTAEDCCNAVAFALQNGAIGFVLKQRSPEVLHRAIRAGVAGETWLERSTMAAAFRSSDNPCHGNANANGNGGNGLQKLTSREREIIDLVALGLHNKEIAERLKISDTTVRHHLTSIFGKLDVANRLTLMRLIFESDAQSDLMSAAAIAR